MDTVSQNQILQIGLMFLLFVTWFLLPLVPAILIHRLLPRNKMNISGPLKGLTVNASGGIASYVLLLLLAYAFVETRLAPRITALDDGAWKFNIPFMVQNANGDPMVFDTGKLTVDVITSPNPSYRRDGLMGYEAQLTATPIGGRLPTVALVGHLSSGAVARSQPIDLARLVKEDGDREVKVPMRPLRVTTDLQD